MDELIQKKSWLSRNWKWCIPLVLFVGIIFGLLATSKLGRTLVGIAKVYSESSVCIKALEIANNNMDVNTILGELQPLGNLAILEGAHHYSDDYSRLELTVDVKGSKIIKNSRSKMDIVALRKGDEWNFESIKIRIKKPLVLKQTIVVLKSKE